MQVGEDDDWVLRLGQGFRGFPSPRSDFQGSIESAKIINGRVVAFSEILEEVPMVEIEEREKMLFEMKKEEEEEKLDPIPVHRVENSKKKNRNKSFECLKDDVRDRGFYHPVPVSMYEHGTSHRVYDTTSSRSGVVSRRPRHEIVRKDWGACLRDDRNYDDGRTRMIRSITPRRGHEVRWRRGSGDAFLARSPVIHQQQSNLSIRK